MADLRKRFGALLGTHRRRRGLTREGLAEAAGLSLEMISKIEVGDTGARFPSIERLAQALDVDPAELFTSDLPSGSMRRGAYGEIAAKLSSLPESDLVWISDLLDLVLRPRSGSEVKTPWGESTSQASAALFLSQKNQAFDEIVSPEFLPIFFA